MRSSLLLTLLHSAQFYVLHSEHSTFIENFYVMLLKRSAVLFQVLIQHKMSSIPILQYVIFTEKRFRIIKVEFKILIANAIDKFN